MVMVMTVKAEEDKDEERRTKREERERDDRRWRGVVPMYIRSMHRGVVLSLCIFGGEGECRFIRSTGYSVNDKVC